MPSRPRCPRRTGRRKSCTRQCGTASWAAASYRPYDGWRCLARRPKADQIAAAGLDGVPRLYQIFKAKARTMNREDYNLVLAFEKQPGVVNALAFNLITRASPACGPERVLGASREIATAIGTEGMVGGQVLDLLGEGRTFPGWSPPQPMGPMAEFVQAIHVRKTAALIRASVRAGAMLCGAESGILEALSAYGERMGLAYQIIDDVLDVVGDERTLGKRAGSDAAKATYPAAFGVAGSREIAARLTEEAVAAIRPLGVRGTLLQELARSLLAREH